METMWLVLVQVSGSTDPELAGLGAYVNVVTPARTAEVAEQRVVRALRDLGWDQVSTEEPVLLDERCREYEVHDTVKSAASRSRRSGTPEFADFYAWDDSARPAQGVRRVPL